ncbi:uncharacterized protein AMSG_07763 [Thecamonas trahens ATCC 50062]|uniref:Uncharacterized protein n=1 Tax=Thecamonas trahens ATCC 50062 TaxID=461836 RepID=A0A0L0DH72_THETB|nr:hypothetical protein AMSG_07763 [Thecamonas trahens ATCC 50062]KNC51699.1 hypothetical protein AMSG_07763 [Thecamonas trahens ATCC 50062]|eukprot:XP_013755828.1 hypothetical protein AMSG_07763 [Thecamonas trahens ATCC 50062]
MSDNEDVRAVEPVEAGKTEAEAMAQDAAPATDVADGKAEEAESTEVKAPRPKPAAVRKPDFDKLKEEEAVIQVDIDAAHEELRRIKAELDSKDSSSKEIMATRDKEQQVLKDIHKQQKKLQGARREIVGRIEEQRARNKKVEASQEALRRHLGKYNTVEKIESRIAALESAIETTASSLRDERELLAQITALKRDRTAVVEYEALTAAVAANKAALDPLYEELRAKEAEIKELKAVESEQHSTVVSLRNRIKDARGNSPSLWKQRKEVKSKLDALYDARRKLRNDFRASKKAYSKYWNELKKWKDEMFAARRAEREAERKAEAAAEAAARAEDERELIPHIAEMKICSALIGYLQDALTKASVPFTAVDTQVLIYGEGISVPGLDDATDAAKPAGLPSLPKPRRVARDNAPTGRRIGKNAEDDDDSIGRHGRIRKKGGKKRGGKKKKKAILSMAPQVMADFAKVGLEAPLELDAVPAAIDALVARIGDYKDGKPPKIAKAAGAKAKAGTAKAEQTPPESSAPPASSAAPLSNGPPGFGAIGDGSRVPAPVSPAPVPTATGGVSYAALAAASVTE